MADQFRVEPGGVSQAGVGLSSVAGDLGLVDLAGPLLQAAGSLAGSGTAQQAGQLAGVLDATLQELTGAVQAMGRAAALSVGNYQAVEGFSAGLFNGFALGSASGMAVPAIGPR